MSHLGRKRVNGVIHTRYATGIDRLQQSDRGLSLPHAGAFFSQILEKRMNTALIKVTRQEADQIRKQVPDAHITIVNRGKSYKKYWAEESRGVMRLLYKLRSRKRRWQ